MQAILMSIKARHNKNIEEGIKISELRKRIPQCDYPIKVYTYESGFDGRHKVVNEWICKNTTEWRICMGVPAHLSKRACVSVEEIREYSGKNYDNIIEMEISDLKIYDKSKELKEFCTRRFGKNDGCDNCINKNLWREDTADIAKKICGPCQKDNFRKQITHPPQSWCYVEELQ